MMDDSRRPGQPAAGLCPKCGNVQVITSSRGSTFYLCRVSARDKRFPKYPGQPVVRCIGYAAADGGGGGNGFTNGETE